MKVFFPASVLLGALTLTACGGGTDGSTTTPEPTPTISSVSLSGAVKLGTTFEGTPSAYHTDADAAGRPLTVRAYSGGATSQALATQALTRRPSLRAQAIHPNDPLLLTTTVGAGLTYSFTLDAAVPASAQSVVASPWPSEGGEANIACTRTMDRISNPAAKIASGYIELGAGGRVDHDDFLVSETFSETATSYTSTSLELAYASASVKIEAQGRCTATSGGRTFTLNMDTVLDLKAGWNLVNSTSVYRTTGVTDLTNRISAVTSATLFALE